MKRYDVIIGGNRTTLLLSDEDARARGLTPAVETAAASDSPPSEPAPEDVTTKSRTPANKSRRPAAKRTAHEA